MDKELRKKVVPIKLTMTEFKALRAKAEEHTKGNISEWIRYAALNLSPKTEDLLDDSNSHLQEEQLQDERNI
jgi:hypothetical protein